MTEPSKTLATPHRLLTARSEKLSNFANRLGLAFYTEWSAGVRDLMLSDDIIGAVAPVGTDVEVVSIVRSQIFRGAALGLIKVAVDINEALFTRRGRRIAPGEDEVDVRSDPGFNWYLQPEFWSQNQSYSSIQWAGSTANVPLEFITHKDSPSHSVKERFDEPIKALKTKLIVVNPDEVLRNLIEFEKIPTVEALKSYHQYVSIELNAAISAAWRYIAVNDIEFSHGDLEVIIEEMNKYLVDNGLKIRNANDDGYPTNFVLRVIATKMKIQWNLLRKKKIDHVSLPVLMNSTPVKKDKGPPALF